MHFGPEDDAGVSPAQRMLDELAAMERDAAKWRALIGSARIRPIGCAGLLPGSGPDSVYGHLGLELWTRHAHVPNDTEHQRGVEWLELYVEKAQRAQAARGVELACNSCDCSTPKGGDRDCKWGWECQAWRDARRSPIAGVKGTEHG
jgi:hypothetical protein